MYYFCSLISKESMAVKAIGKVLVVDDNQGVRRALDFVLKGFFEEVGFLSNPVTLLRKIEDESPDVVLLDMNFSSELNTGSEGLYWLREVKNKFPEVDVVLFTAYADIELAVEGMKYGAADFVVKPWDNSRLISVLRGIIAKRKKGSNKHETTVFRGSSPKLKELWRKVSKIATSDANVLIIGESGTGKRTLARELIRLNNDGIISPIVFNPENYMTISSVNSGEPFIFVGLDEITNEQRQTLIKMALENNNRIVCTALSDIGNDDFIKIFVPSLKECAEDLDAMAHHFIRESNKRHNRMIDGIESEGVDLMKRYSWKCNVKELKERIDKLVVLGDDDLITRRAIFEELGNDPDFLSEVKGLTDDEEASLIKRTLEKTGNNVSAAAKLLKISRPTLYSKISKYKL